MIYVIIQFNSILLLSIKTPITEQYNHMKNIYIKTRDVIYSDLYFNVLEGARVAQFIQAYHQYGMGSRPAL